MNFFKVLNPGSVTLGFLAAPSQPESGQQNTTAMENKQNAAYVVFLLVKQKITIKKVTYFTVLPPDRYIFLQTSFLMRVLAVLLLPPGVCIAIP
jgi:hypothetical protein